MSGRNRLLLLLVPGAFLVLLALAGCAQVSAILDQAPTAKITVSPSSGWTVNSQITLNGSGSSDPQSYQLDYTWNLTTPSGSNATLSATDQEIVTFTPDVVGTYTVLLQVTAISTSKKTDSVSKEITVSGGNGTGTGVQAPTNLGASTVSSSSIGLVWNASSTSGATYDVYRGTYSGGESTTPIGTSSTNSYTDSGLSPSTTYYYYVTAVVNGTQSGHSNEFYATTSSVSVNPPSSLTASASSSALSISLSWNASSTAGVTYRIYRGTYSGGESSTPIATSSATSYTDTDPLLQPGTTYFYYVTAVLSGVESSHSNEASATTASAGSIGVTLY